MFSLDQRLAVRERARYNAQCREALLDLNDSPHLLVAVEIRGAHFPQLDAEPFVRIADAEGESARSWITQVEEDGSAFVGYFPVDALLNGKVLEFGYGDAVFGRMSASRLRTVKLDQADLPASTKVVTYELIRNISKIDLRTQDPLLLQRN
jgi:hypothetical protein